MSKKEISIYTAGSAADLGDIKTNWRKSLPDIKSVRWLHPDLAPVKKEFCFAFPRDIIQLRESDAILAVFTAGRIQRGTSAEVGISYALNKIIIIVSDSKENDYELRYILGLSHLKVRTIKEALKVITFMAKGFI